MKLSKMDDTQDPPSSGRRKSSIGVTTALGAWAASLPLALFPPVALWVLCISVMSPASMFYGLVIAAISCAVHLASYAVTGLPIFLWKFRRPESLVWRLPISLLVGALCGPGVAMVVILRNNASPSDPPVGPLIVCGLYGLITAVSAYRQRPLLENQTCHLP